MYRNNGIKPIHPGPCVSIVSHGTRAIVQPLITAARTKGSSILRNLIPDTYSPSMPKTEKEMRKAEQKHPRISSRSPTKISFSSTFRGSFFSSFSFSLSLFLSLLFPLLSQSTLTMQRGMKMTHPRQLSKKEVQVMPTRRIKIQLQKSLGISYVTYTLNDFLRLSLHVFFRLHIS